MIDACEQMQTDHVVQRFEREIRVYGRSAVADQKAVVVNLTRITGFHDERCFCARSLAHEVMMQTRGGKETRNRSVVFIDLTVRQNQDRCPGTNRNARRLEQILESAPHALTALGCVEAHRECDGTKALP